MIIIAIGANLPHPEIGDPLAVCRAAVTELERSGLEIVTYSRWYRSAPVPASDQPDYINGAVRVETADRPESLMQRLHAVEARFGRARTVPNAPRTLDLDLIAYRDVIRKGPDSPILPHPRMAERAFVLRPVAEIAPDWRHPVLGRTAAELLARLPTGQDCEALDNAPGR